MNLEARAPRQARAGRCSLAVLALTALLAALGAPAPPAAFGQAIDPPFESSYSLTDIGPPPGVPPELGGLTLKAGTTDRLLIGGAANAADGALYEVGLIRDGSGHITGFSGAATRFADAAYNDGGVTYGPGGVLFLARWPVNELGQTKPGSSITDKVIALAPLGVTPSPGALLFVPPGQPGAGSLKLTSWEGGQWYDADVTPDGSGRYDLQNVTPVAASTLPGGPEGFIYVTPGSPQFIGPSMLVSEYSAGQVGAYQVDANGDPVIATRRTFMSGLTGAEGAFIDPVTGDFLFSTFGGGDRVIVVRGFAQPAGATLSINDVAATEGDSGTTNAVFTVSLSQTSAANVGFNFNTADGTATQPADYTSSGGSGSITAGSTSTTISVPLKGDTLDEDNETFQINLSGATIATIADGQGIGTITDDDPPPALSIGNVTVREGNSGVTNATFTVSLSAASGKAIAVGYATANGSATAPADYASASGSVNFGAGQTSRTVTVAVAGDTVDEPNETFNVNLSGPTNATIADSQGVGTITDDDPPPLGGTDVPRVIDVDRLCGVTRRGYCNGLRGVTNFRQAPGNAVWDLRGKFIDIGKPRASRNVTLKLSRLAKAITKPSRVKFQLRILRRTFLKARRLLLRSRRGVLLLQMTYTIGGKKTTTRRTIRLKR